MKYRNLLITILVTVLPVAALTSCKERQASGSDSAGGRAEAKYHYAVAMTGVV